ncbi:MAG: ABC-F family ATP-binding cassette domain-containing protein, partial [Rhodospirillales bacterium]|nr:ABC-F family ATP-binding cassette domain-containing protein [Rhodospirillales bacterium]
ADVHTRLADIEAHSAPALAAAILAGLGFDDDAQARPCSDFSGGWRMRVALAAVLFSRPDLLLLDEPTNHLDLEATLWLESYLASWSGTLIVISHDRTLLNQSVDEIIHLQGGKLTRYTGGYDRFEKTRREQLSIQSKMQARQMTERKHIEKFVERFRYTASKARQAQSRLKMLARMEPIVSVMEERTVTFQFPNPDPLSPPIIALDNVSVGYEPDKPVLKNLNLRIDMDDRIGLLGANGNGKSTMVRLLADRLKHQGGKLHKSSKLRVGYFAQHQTEELDLDATPFSHGVRMLPMEPEHRVRAHLGRFGFPQDRADTRVGDLSGGEKARLLFALMSVHKPHLMLLDEPTNHLDVDSREALVMAMNDFDGAVILVSHDPHLIELTCDSLWLVADGTCRPYDEDLAAYRAMLLDRGRKSRSQEGNGSSSRKDARRQRATARAETTALRKSVREAEKHMEKLTAKIAEMESRLADPVVYEGPTAVLRELQIQHSNMKKELADAEKKWLKAHEALDAAE